MKYTVKRKGFFSRTLALVLAMTIMMSTVIISGLSLTVFAASSIAGNTIYLDISNNSNWKDKTIIASFDNGVTQTAAFTGSGNQLTVKIPAEASDADKMTLTAYPSGYPTELANAAPSGKYRIITINHKSRNYCYAWNSASGANNAAWPGQQMTQSGDYYYIDFDNKFENCIFSIGSNDSKSADMVVDYNGNAAYYDGAAFVMLQSSVVNISSLSSTQNLFYMNSDNSVSVSKYHYNGTSIEAPSKTVYLYNPNWNAAYVTYDLGDAYQVTNSMTLNNSEEGVTYFYGSVPVGATIRFQPSMTSSSGGSSNLTAPSDDKPLYIMDSSNYWTTFDNLPKEENRIPNTFGSNIHGVKATYFDYMSDAEIENGYLNRTQSRVDKPFDKYLNAAISSYSDTNKIKYPLYFGNLYGTSDGYNSFYNFYNIINNSAGLNGGNSYWYSVQGLASSTLVNGQLYVPSSNEEGAAESPLFNASWLTDSSVNGKGELAKVFNSYFPFVSTTDDNGITTYSFDSSGGGTRASNGDVTGADRSKSDNVYFTWDGTTPVAVNYGYGSDYAVSDGSQSGQNEFNVGGTGFGIFPFNNTSSTSSVFVPDGTTTTVDKSSRIYVQDKGGWGSVCIWAWSSSKGKWYDPSYDEQNGMYYFTKDQTTDGARLGDQTGFQFCKNHNGEKRTSDLSLSNYWGKRTNTDNTGYTTTDGIPDTEQGGKTYKKTASDAYNDYGFGIRLDMDFRVPANGVLNQPEYTVPQNEIWVQSDNSDVYCYGYGGNEVGLSKLVKNEYGFYVIGSKYVGVSENFILASDSSWSNQYPPGGTDKKIADYLGSAIKYSSSGFTPLDVAGDPVTFKYSGDDDLWVYISDDEGNSELVLDLGGDHKFSSGEINFKTMRATADFVHTNYNTATTEKPAVPSTEVWIKKDSYSTLYLKTWNKTDQYGNPYDTYIEPYATVNYTFSDGHKEEFFKYKISDLDGATQFTINTAKTTAGKLCTLDMSSANVSGNVFSINSRAEGYLAETYTHTNSSTISYPATSVSSSFFGGQQLDPNKTYHMTVFYMERGLIESNFQVSFTMTPVTNNLLVDKEVQIGDDINNSVIEKAVYDNDTFGYVSSNENESTLSGKRYTYTDRSGDTTTKTLGSNGAFGLKDSESAYFVSQFDTGSNMTVTENSVSSMKNGTNLSDRYNTNWILYDSGAILGFGDTATAQFALEGEDKTKNANLELTYTNTLKTGALELKKNVFDKQNQPIEVDEDFSYTVLLDINGGEDYTAYPLNYSVISGGTTTTHYTSDGTLSFSPRSTIKIEGLPIGATYKIVENVPEGYTCTNNNQIGTIASTTSVVTFSNTQCDGEDTITVSKTLDGEEYTGSQFEFVLQGLEAASDDYVDASGMTYTASSVSKGAVTFTLKFNEVGKYRFKVSESAMDSSLLGYNGDSNTYYMEFSVRENADTKLLEINDADTKYYSDENFTKAIDGITFVNTTEKAKITINKKNPQNNSNGTDGTKFAVIRVSKAEGITNDDVKEIMSDKPDNKLKDVLVQTGTTSGGKLEFDNLPVYQDSSKKMYNAASKTAITGDNYLTGKSTPQIYCVVEYKATSGYNLNSTPYYVTFPLKADDNALKAGYYKDSDGYVRVNDTNDYVFEQKFDYTNYPVVVPNASGEGVNSFITIGIMIIAGAAALTAAYFGCGYINRKRRRARATARRR